MHYIAYIDGAARGVNGQGATASGFVVFQDGFKVFEDAHVYPEPHTNNFAEYGALIMALAWAVQYEIPDFLVRSDSQLVVRQMNGQYRVGPELLALHDQAKKLSRQVKNFQIEWVRGHAGDPGNEAADEICNRALDGKL